MALTPITNTWHGWQYAYQYPSDCLEFRYIFNPYLSQTINNFVGIYPVYRPNPTVQNIPFEVVAATDGNSRVILTNQPGAIGIYTKQITNTGLFTPLFVDALAARLAAECACTILINSGVHNLEMQKYMAFIADAEAAAGTEEASEVFVSNPIIDSRN
jgi:hypothetical protein